MLLPTITHAVVVEVDSKGVSILEDAGKLIRQKGGVEPDLTKVERYSDSEGESDLSSAEDEEDGDEKITP